MSKSKLLNELIEIGCFKFGDFTLKSGAKSPIYVDLRPIVSYPSILSLMADAIWEMKNLNGIDADLICGVPYTALPIATAISVTRNVPMVLRRKEAKSYGTKKIVEGIFKPAQKCLIIEDIVTSGLSVLETVDVLKKEGLEVTDCVVVLNREQGGEVNLKNHNVIMHTLFNLTDVLLHLTESGIISEEITQSVEKYLQEQKNIPIQKDSAHPVSFPNRADKNVNAIFKKLCRIIEEKKSNLCVAVDVTSSAELLRLAKELGPHICILKTHIDILADFDENVPTQLKELAARYNFLLLEDRKFADIGNTVLHQFTEGVYKINDWADIVTVHSIPGEGILKALANAATPDRACLLIAQMSTKGALTNDDYAKATLALAEEYKHYVIGFISQSAITTEKGFLHLSPGVSLSSTTDSLGQQYRTVDKAIIGDDVDIVIVGRGITESQNIVDAVTLYRKRSFDAYKQKIA